MSAQKKKAMTDEELVRELREFHHYESARRLEQLSRLHRESLQVVTQIATAEEKKEDVDG